MTAPVEHQLGGGVSVWHGECLDVMRGMPDASVDAVVTDPPYGLSAHPRRVVEAALRAWLSGDREHVPNLRGFMGRNWDGFVPPPAVWDECYRVLKPGGHLLSFAGARTVDLMGISIRLAGFETRDTEGLLGWVYSQGFPKSRDVAKDIDRMVGAEREIVGPRIRLGDKQPYAYNAKDYDGAIIGERGARILTAPATEDAKRWAGFGTALKPAWEPIIAARKPLAGTVAANVLAHGTGALNVDACRVEANARPARQSLGRSDDGTLYGAGLDGSRAVGTTDLGRWPTNLVLSHGDCTDDACAPGCPVAELDRQSGASVSRIGQPRGAGAGDGWGMTATGSEYADHGGASRFYPVFRYEPKAPTHERPKVRRVDGTWEAHPTVKPLELIRWLCRLVCPPGGTILDCFAGSGPVGEAAIIEGFQAWLIEREPCGQCGGHGCPDHIGLIKTRLSKPIQPVLFSEGTPA